jgi:hypothetical protein
MAVAAVVMAVLPVPPGAIAIVVLGLPVFAAVVFYSAITNRKWADRFRYTGALVRDGRLDARQRGRAKLAATRTEFKRSMLMLGLFLAVFVAGLVLGGLAVGINEAIYGVSG